MTGSGRTSPYPDTADGASLTIENGRLEVSSGPPPLNRALARHKNRTKSRPGDFKTSNTSYVYGETAAIHIFLAILCVLLSACATSYSRIANTEAHGVLPVSVDAASKLSTTQRSGDILLFVAFSGGGTRAAAFSYGVLEELRDTHIRHAGKDIRLLDEIDAISSVSGGSFTAAYYRLFGDQIFEDYEDRFLKRNVQQSLINSMLNPANWFRLLASGFDRTELAIDYYDRNIFHGRTFGDLLARPGPRLDINATDLSIGERFTFSAERFRLLCSDISDFHVARAVAASSAVPVAFAPIVLKNYDSCKIQEPEWLTQVRQDANPKTRLQGLIAALDSYRDKQARPYIHLVDGGITDNLGVRAIYDRVKIMGGAVNAARLLQQTTPKVIAVIVVNAGTRPSSPMDLSSDEPNAAAIMSAVSRTELQRYSVESLALMHRKLGEWADELSTEGYTVTPYFITLDFESIADLKTRSVFNNMATSFSLPAEEVDALKDAGHRLLRQSPEFKQLLSHLQTAKHTSQENRR
jgi:NTE family protein